MFIFVGVVVVGDIVEGGGGGDVVFVEKGDDDKDDDDCDENDVFGNVVGNVVVCNDDIEQNDVWVVGILDDFEDMIFDIGIEVKWFLLIFFFLLNEIIVVFVMDIVLGIEYVVGSVFILCVVIDGEFVVYFVNVEDLGIVNVVFVVLVVNFLVLFFIVVVVNNFVEEVKILIKVVVIVCVVVICVVVCKVDVVGIFDIDNEFVVFVKFDDIDIDCVFGIVGEDDDDGIFEDVGMFNVFDIVDVGIIDVVCIVDDVGIVDDVCIVDVDVIIDVVEGVFDDFVVVNDEDLFWFGVYWDMLFIVVVVWVEGFVVEDIDVVVWGVVGFCLLLLFELFDEVVELVRGLVEVDI